MVTDEVLQFFVFCATFVLSVGLFFSTRSFLFQAMSLSTLCEKNSVLNYHFESLNLNPRVLCFRFL